MAEQRFEMGMQVLRQGMGNLSSAVSYAGEKSFFCGKYNQFKFVFEKQPLIARSL
jgi:hypothetical protein